MVRAVIRTTAVFARHPERSHAEAGAVFHWLALAGDRDCAAPEQNAFRSPRLAAVRLSPKWSPPAQSSRSSVWLSARRSRAR